MSQGFQIQEGNDALVIGIREEINGPEGLLGAGVAGVAVAIVSAIFLSLKWALLLGVPTAVAGFLTRQARWVEIRVTQMEFVVRRNFGRSSHCMSISTADVRALEFREGDKPQARTFWTGGLYALQDGGDLCLLPGLSREESAHATARFEQKFPCLAERWRSAF
jgi:hypothetical protein